MKKYVRPQVNVLEVAIEGDVFAGSPDLNTFGTSTSVDTSNLGTSGSGVSNSTFNLRERLAPQSEVESNEIYDELFQ